MAEISKIRREVSLFWGLVPLKTEDVKVGYEVGFNDTWHEDTGNGEVEGRSRFFRIEVTSVDTVTIHDWKNDYCGYSDTTLTGEQINKHKVSVPPSCIGGLAQSVVGFKDRYVYKSGK